MSTESLWIVIAVVVAVLLVAVVVGLVVARNRRISLRDDEELETGEREPPKGGTYQASGGFDFAGGTATAPERPATRGPAGGAPPDGSPAGFAAQPDGAPTDGRGASRPGGPTGTVGGASLDSTGGTAAASGGPTDTADRPGTTDAAASDTANAGDTVTRGTAAGGTADEDDTATAVDVRTPPGGMPVDGGATEARTPPGGIAIVDAPTPPRGTPVAPPGQGRVIGTAEASRDPDTARLDTRTAGSGTTGAGTGAGAGTVAATGAATADPATADPSAPDTATRTDTTTRQPGSTIPADTAPPTTAPATAPPAPDGATAIGGATAPGAPTEDIAPAEGRINRLRGRLSRSRTGLGQSLLGLLGAGQMDDESWEDVEATLLQADLGPEMTEEITTRLREQLASRGVRTADEARAVLRDVLTEALDTNQDRSVRALPHDGRPAVLLVVGVNGTGKTTTTGKLARVLVAGGHRVTLGAADTFRAAAAEQLVTWGERAGAGVVRGPEGSDPASVAFDAVKRGTDDGVDAVLLDTAGRLHTKTGLMDELGKVKRVVDKQARVDEVLLVLDATTGQNGLTQARVFGEVVDVTGIALTKLDGTAKGGIVFRVQRELGVPVKLVGLGEGADDLAPFEPAAFVDALLD